MTDLPLLYAALSPHETTPEGVHRSTQADENVGPTFEPQHWKGSEVPPPAKVKPSTRTNQDGRLHSERQQRRESEIPQAFEMDVIEDSPMGFDNHTQQVLSTGDEMADIATQESPDLDKLFDVKTLYPDESYVGSFLPVSPEELPSTQVAAALIEHYREGMHKWLPILSSDFETQLLAYHTHADAVPSQYLAITNLVFAIGARYALLVDDAQYLSLDGCLEHNVYMSRALQLLDSRASPIWASKPDIAVVQVSY